VRHRILSADPNAEIEALLRALKDGIEATAVGVLDGARAWLHASSEKSPGTFWAVFNGMDCLRPDWDRWEADLMASGRSCVDCGCGLHTVESFGVRGLWVVIVLATGGLGPVADQVVAQALPILARLLPTAGSKWPAASPLGGGPGGGGQGPAALAIPAWWIRRRASS
jgi:hypothetical protein